MKWRCEIWDIVNEMQDDAGNTITDINTLLYDSLTGGEKYHRVQSTYLITVFQGKTQNEITRQIEALQRDILPLSMFIGEPDYRWTIIADRGPQRCFIYHRLKKGGKKNDNLDS